MTAARTLRGTCLCGSIRMTVETAETEVRECHCTQCRRQSGHVWAFLTVPQSAVRWIGDEPVIYRHTAKADRGFCAACGSFLFWRENGSDSIDLSAGLFDAPTGLHLIQPVHTEGAGDYYDLGSLQAPDRAEKSSENRASS